MRTRYETDEWMNIRGCSGITFFCSFFLILFKQHRVCPREPPSALRVSKQWKTERTRRRRPNVPMPFQFHVVRDDGYGGTLGRHPSARGNGGLLASWYCSKYQLNAQQGRKIASPACVYKEPAIPVTMGLAAPGMLGTVLRLCEGKRLVVSKPEKDTDTRMCRASHTGHCGRSVMCEVRRKEFDRPRTLARSRESGSGFGNSVEWGIARFLCALLCVFAR